MNIFFHILTTIIFFFLVHVVLSEPLESSDNTAVITQEETQGTKPLQNLRRGLERTLEHPAQTNMKNSSAADLLRVLIRHATK
jgi:hypothetical protein